jgi:hypothetical protein
MDQFDRVLEVDETSRAARIQAGVYGPELEDQLRPKGYTLRHFPQSFTMSTLGGWIATRSGGHYATNHHRRLRRVSAAPPAGSLARVRRRPYPDRWCSERGHSASLRRPDAHRASQRHGAPAFSSGEPAPRPAAHRAGQLWPANRLLDPGSRAVGPGSMAARRPDHRLSPDLEVDWPSGRRSRLPGTAVV